MNPQQKAVRAGREAHVQFVNTSRDQDEGDQGESSMDVRRMFNRVLQTWAMDVLSLKRRGLERPSLRQGLGEDEDARASGSSKKAA